MNLKSRALKSLLLLTSIAGSLIANPAPRQVLSQEFSEYHYEKLIPAVKALNLNATSLKAKYWFGSEDTPIITIAQKTQHIRATPHVHGNDQICRDLYFFDEEDGNGNKNGVWDYKEDVFRDMNGDGIYNPSDEDVLIHTGTEQAISAGDEGIQTGLYSHSSDNYPSHSNNFVTFNSGARAIVKGMVDESLCYRDSNGNGEWDEGEDVWQDVDDGDSNTQDKRVYNPGVDIKIHNGGEDDSSWETNAGDWGKQVGLFFQDHNNNTKWDEGEPLWFDHDTLVSKSLQTMYDLVEAKMTSIYNPAMNRNYTVSEYLAFANTGHVVNGNRGWTKIPNAGSFSNSNELTHITEGDIIFKVHYEELYAVISKINAPSESNLYGTKKYTAAESQLAISTAVKVLELGLTLYGCDNNIKSLLNKLRNGEFDEGKTIEASHINLMRAIIEQVADDTIARGNNPYNLYPGSGEVNNYMQKDDFELKAPWNGQGFIVEDYSVDRTHLYSYISTVVSEPEEMKWSNFDARKAILKGVTNYFNEAGWSYAADLTNGGGWYGDLYNTQGYLDVHFNEIGLFSDAISNEIIVDKGEPAYQLLPIGEDTILKGSINYSPLETPDYGWSEEDYTGGLYGGHWDEYSEHTWYTFPGYRERSLGSLDAVVYFNYDYFEWTDYLKVFYYKEAIYTYPNNSNPHGPGQVTVRLRPATPRGYVNLNIDWGAEYSLIINYDELINIAKSILESPEPSAQYITIKVHMNSGEDYGTFNQLTEEKIWSHSSDFLTSPNKFFDLEHITHANIYAELPLVSYSSPYLSDSQSQLTVVPTNNLPIITNSSSINIYQDNNLDNISQIGTNLQAFGRDSGIIEFTPENREAQVYLPLYSGKFINLPIHAAFVQGSVLEAAEQEEPETRYLPRGRNYHMTFTDIDDQGLPYFYTLHTRVLPFVYINNNGNHIKRVEVIRPKGNSVVFEFEWNGSAFEPYGTPVSQNLIPGSQENEGLNGRRTYVLRDKTPESHTDLNYELHFASGIIHVYSEGRLSDVKHIDGRHIVLSTLQKFSANNLQSANGTLPNGTTDSALKNIAKTPKYFIDMEWKHGRFNKLIYKVRGKGDNAKITTDLGYDKSSIGNDDYVAITLNKKDGISNNANIAPFSYSYNRVRGIDGEFGTNKVTSNGTEVTRLGPDSAPTLITESSAFEQGDSLSVAYTFNDSHLVTDIEVAANSDTATTTMTYIEGNDRYSNGSPKWGKVEKVVYPNTSWSKYTYTEDEGWLRDVISPFMGSQADDNSDTIHRLTRYSYAENNGGEDAKVEYLTEKPRKIVSKIKGKVVGTSFYSFSSTSSEPTPDPGEERNRVELQIATDKTSPAWNKGSNLKTFSIRHDLGPWSVYTPTSKVKVTSSHPGDDETKQEIKLENIVLDGDTVFETTVLTEYAFGLEESIVTKRGENVIGSESTTSDDYWRPLVTTYPSNLTTKFEDYTFLGAQKHYDASGSVTEFEYDVLGQVVSQTHAGLSTNYIYDTLGNANCISNGNSSSSTRKVLYEYDAQSRIKREENFMFTSPNEVTTYSYTQSGGIITQQTVYPTGHSQNTSFVATYIDGSPKETGGPVNSNPIRYDYGVDANKGPYSLVRQKAQGGNYNLEMKSYQNFFGQTYLIEKSGINAEGETLYHPMLNTYDERGRVSTSTNHEGVKTVTTYNNKNELSTVTLVTGENNTGRTTSYVLDYVVIDGEVCRKTNVTPPLGSATTSFAQIDGLKSWAINSGRVSERATEFVTSEDSDAKDIEETTLFKDSTGKVISGSRSISNNGILLKTIQNPTDIFAVEDRNADAEIVVEYTVDQYNRINSSSDPRIEKVSRVTRNNNGAPISLINPFGENGTRTDRMTYNKMGQRKSFIRAGGGRELQSYHENLLPDQLTSDFNFPIKNEYENGNGQQTGLNTSQTGNPAGSDKVKTEWIFGEDHALPLAKKIDNNNNLKYSYYANSGRLKKLEMLNPDGSSNRAIQYEYDLKTGEQNKVIYGDDYTYDITYFDDGQVDTISSTQGNLSYTYTEDDRQLKTISHPLISGVYLEYEYDDAGRKKKVKLFKNTTLLKEINYGYDKVGRPNSVSWGTHTASWNYVNYSNLPENCTFNNGTNNSFSVNKSYRADSDLLNTISARNGSNELIYSNTHDFNMNMQRVSEQIDFPAMHSGQLNIQYAYQHADQLQSAVATIGETVISNRSFIYEFDHIGNSKRYAVPNNYNQVSISQSSGVSHVYGNVGDDVKVQVNGYNSEVVDNKFISSIATSAASAATLLNVEVAAVKVDPVSGDDVVQVLNGEVLEAPASFAHSYDNRGNKSDDDAVTYTFDSRNRLISAVSKLVRKYQKADDVVYQKTENNGSSFFTISASSLNTCNYVRFNHEPKLENPNDYEFGVEVFVNNNWIPAEIQSVVNVNNEDDNYTQFTCDFTGVLTNQVRVTATASVAEPLAKFEIGNSALEPIYQNGNVTFKYDVQGRRIEKVTHSYNPNTGSWNVDKTRRYIYDGWNLIGEFNSNGRLLKSFIWGLDISGSDQGAGGIGGLLAVNNEGAGETYYSFTDGRGNVKGYVDSTDASLVAGYDYGPFGEAIEAIGELKDYFPHRFSSKFWDAENGLYYFGYRSYSPREMKFVSRDPLQEEGTLNMYSYCGNDPLNKWEYLGAATLTERAAKNDLYAHILDRLDGLDPGSDIYDFYENLRSHLGSKELDKFNSEFMKNQLELSIMTSMVNLWVETYNDEIRGSGDPKLSIHTYDDEADYHNKVLAEVAFDFDRDLAIDVLTTPGGGKVLAFFPKLNKLNKAGKLGAGATKVLTKLERGGRLFRYNYKRAIRAISLKINRIAYAKYSLKPDFYKSTADGFSGVFDPVTGIVRIKPSKRVKSLKELPEGFVQRRGGHGAIRRELRGLGVKTNQLRAFTIIKENGKFSIEYFSRGVNSGILDPKLQSAVHKAVKNYTGLSL